MEKWFIGNAEHLFDTSLITDIMMFLEQGGDVAEARCLFKRINAVEREIRAGPRKDINVLPGPPKGYTVRHAVEKNLGAYSLQHFQRGELILMEAPLITLSFPANGHSFISAIKELSDTERQQFLSLHDAHTGSRSGPFSEAGLGSFAPLLNIWITNSFALGGNTFTCLHASRFNHSCSPNAKWSWHEATKTLRIFALQDIMPGEEISVTYLGNITDFASTRNARRKQLQETYAFACNCAVCSLPTTMAVQSDRRRIEIMKTSKLLLSPQHIQTRDRLVKLKHMICLFREEQYVGEAVDCYSGAARMCLTHSDWASSTYWARKAFKMTVDEYGIDSDLAIDAMDMLLNPRLHQMAGRGPAEMFTDVRLE
jgi:hypothetical protein